MKKTILLIVALILIFSLCGTGDSYAVSDRKAREAINKVQAYITKWESARYSAPQANEILEKARQAYKEGNYEKAVELAEESLISLKKEVQVGPVPIVTIQIPDPEVDLTKYKKLMVEKVSDAPDAPSSGVVVADLITTALISRGYDAIYRATPEFEIPDADAIVYGIVSQWEGHTRDQHVHVPVIDKTVYVPTFLITVGITIKMVDAKTGSILWRGYSLHQASSKTIQDAQPVAQAVINAILDKVLKKEAP